MPDVENLSPIRTQVSSPAAVSAIADSLLARSDREIPPILELLSPRSFTLHSQLEISHELLWAEEAKHRSKNLAQIATSLARVHASESLGSPSIESSGRRSASFEEQALVLADAYTELGRSNAATGLMQVDILARVLSGLAALLKSDDREVVVSIEIIDLRLAEDQRRALVLIASELVINAFKHAFPTGTTGRIRVGLSVDAGEVELTVEDDGVGLQSNGAGRSGARLLNGLCSVLGATLRRSGVPSGGLLVVVRFPLDRIADDHEAVGAAHVDSDQLTGPSTGSSFVRVPDRRLSGISLLQATRAAQTL